MIVFLFSSLESMEMMILMIRFPFVFFLSFFLLLLGRVVVVLRISR